MKKLMIILGMITVLTACGSPSASDYETIELEQIQSKIDEGYKVMDVREVNEYDAGHIKDAVNKPLSELKELQFEGINVNENYIIICQSGNRSKEASQILNENSFTIVNVAEGMSSWTGEIERN